MIFFLIIVSLTIVVAICLGYALARKHQAQDRIRLEQDRASLATEWRALEGTRQVRAVFLAARRAMRAEADRHDTATPPRS
jgi:hypothetical protein